MGGVWRDTSSKPESDTIFRELLFALMPRNTSKLDIRATLRIAIWKANATRCFYCQEPIVFADLEIDHLVPTATSRKNLTRIIEMLELPSGFRLDDPLNLVPSHHTCNQRKSDHQFSETNLRYYFEIWQRKQQHIADSLDFLNQQATKDKLLTDLIAQVENGYLSMDEVVSVLRGVASSRAKHVSDPLVLCFGVNLFDKAVKRLRVPHETTVEFMDRLETTLLANLRRHVLRPIAQTESQRSGETISIRIAFWDSDLDRITEGTLAPWEILEATPYSEIYSEMPDELFSRAVEETYSIFDAEARGCPRCGGKVTIASSSSESGEFAIATCQECGWEQYHPRR